VGPVAVLVVVVGAAGIEACDCVTPNDVVVIGAKEGMEEVPVLRVLGSAIVKQE
jgi:hypothetical protein